MRSFCFAAGGETASRRCIGKATDFCCCIVNEKIVLDDLLDIVSSSVGSLTNPSKIQKTFVSVKGTAIADDTISRYLDYFMY